MLEPLESNQNFDSLKMVIAKDRAYIMAIDEKKIQTIYVLFQDDFSIVKLGKLWS
jgi:hypothetical protein